MSGSCEENIPSAEAAVNQELKTVLSGQAGFLPMPSAKQTGQEGRSGEAGGEEGGRKSSGLWPWDGSRLWKLQPPPAPALAPWPGS